MGQNLFLNVGQMVAIMRSIQNLASKIACFKFDLC